MIPCIFLHQAPRCRIIQHSYLSHDSCHPRAECNSIQRNHLLPTRAPAPENQKAQTWYNLWETKLRKYTSTFFSGSQNQGLEAQTSVFLPDPFTSARSKKEHQLSFGRFGCCKSFHVISTPFRHRLDTPSIHTRTRGRGLRRHGHHVPLT